MTTRTERPKWWEIRGEDRQIGALGELEPFEMALTAPDEATARERAIKVRGEKREHVRILTCRQR